MTTSCFHLAVTYISLIGCCGALALFFTPRRHVAQPSAAVPMSSRSPTMPNRAAMVNGDRIDLCDYCTIG
ncbi:hypothetical protein BOTBODRAFT_522386 [Botryobasidium botryosum FD-172 SS1]|uniref:Uncharacterized protein n=1 Tax=Botryobasidium botryosum (strain FD-172 SS1) TaxID=930990 RepID=A0A067M1J2_BOTB1|nr:hypothetical protein BOTBODRAFT_522386 [Botryobasidium botryosum FD-172 SS1]